METHPVPQNISSYEFRLVGDMTLKQFLQLAGGMILGLIIFRLPLIGIIKYPLTIIPIILGVLMAFVPVNNRPFSTWFFAFVKAIYSPTEYVWKPTPATNLASVTPAPASPPEVLTKEGQKATNPQFVPSFTSIITSKLPNIAPATPTQTTSSTVTIVPEKKPEPTPTPIQPIVPEVKTIPQTAPPPTPAAAPQTVAVPPSPLSASVQTAPQAEATSLVSAPTTPNVLSGMVNNSAGQPLIGITVEIIDTATGIPARALRTNRLGQFQIAIPLSPGTYNVIAEKEGLSFDPVSIQVKGAIIPPIILTAKT